MLSPPDPQLENALSAYTAALPRQARLIHLAGEVLRLLAEVQAGLPSPPGMTASEAEARLAAGETILAPVLIPPADFRPTLGRMLEIFQKFELLPPLPSDLCQTLLSRPPQAWLEETGSLGEISRSQDFPAGLLLFLGQKALAPFYQQAAASFLPLFLGGKWSRSICPGCGREPVLASLAPDSGQRLLYCSLCAAQWPFSRQTCVFCGNREPKFSYIFAEDDPARRADLCRTCQRYLKTIVTGRLPHLLHLPLEEFVTVDLDTLMARDDLHI
jgi:hypothetical protein